MNKPNALRQALNEAVPWVAENPENLSLFVDSGSIVSTLAKSLSWEYRYKLNLIVMQFSGDQNLLIAPILMWLRQHQPDMFAHSDQREKGFQFEVDIINHTTANISVDLQLTERVIVRQVEGDWVVEAVDEPEEPDEWIE